MYQTLSTRRIAAIIFALIVTTTIAMGCGAPGFLITLTTTKRNLVETELRRDSLFAVDKIAMIDVTGVILNMPEMQLLGEGEHPVSMLLEQLDKARRDRAVKAVILRINSPGGAVVASKLMHDEIKHFKESGKPVVAVMMDVAASGGYYIACACDEIVAQSSTITGSIGVVMQMFDLSGTMDLIGVRSDAILSGVHKDSGSLFREMRPEERELFQAIVNEMYERFVEVVMEGRPELDEAEVRSLADGRVYTGTQALEVGLVDRVATLRETVDAVKERIGSTRIRLVAYKRPLGYRPNYYAKAPDVSNREVNLINVDLPAWLDRTTPRFMYLWHPGM
ncbi:MAG: signal peptide peptidase SppA [Phycisphaerales bacterium]|nr:MAG: signal peptide peptidase SppA [Phycisphaerales bacterium]